MHKKNIVLIGMPSSGKTTVGKTMGNNYKLKCIDTDDLIKKRENKELAYIVKDEGMHKFLQIQDEVICDIIDYGVIISTGGGVIHSEKAMKHLKENGVVFFLETEYSVIESRLSKNRSLVRSSGQSYLDIFNERQPLYKKYADFIIHCNGKESNEIVKLVFSKYRNLSDSYRP